MRRLTTVFALSAAILLALSGIAFADAEVTIGDDGLDPQSVEVDIRESIVWTNASDAAVSLVGKEPGWVSGRIEPGATFSIKITQKGTYEYSSEDGSLEGEIVVAGGDPVDEKAPEDKPDDPVKEGDKGDQKGGAQKRDAEPLAETGINATLPAGLSVLLIALGAGLLLGTRPSGAAV